MMESISEMILHLGDLFTQFFTDDEPMFSLWMKTQENQSKWSDMVKKYNKKNEILK